MLSDLIKDEAGATLTQYSFVILIGASLIGIFVDLSGSIEAA